MDIELNDKLYKDIEASLLSNPELTSKLNVVSLNEGLDTAKAILKAAVLHGMALVKLQLKYGGLNVVHVLQINHGSDNIENLGIFTSAEEANTFKRDNGYDNAYVVEVEMNKAVMF